MKKQVGFTLVELLIAMALGLIIAASATMLFLTGLKSQALQTGQSGLQDDANFGLNFILKDVRLSNEPYRVCRRVNILRDYPDDKIKIYP